MLDRDLIFFPHGNPTMTSSKHVGPCSANQTPEGLKGLRMDGSAVLVFYRNADHFLYWSRQLPMVPEYLYLVVPRVVPI